jgi:uncharacterized protein (UPF0147 family)
MNAKTDPALRQRIAGMLGRTGNLPELIDIALDKVAEPELRGNLLRLLDKACEEGTDLGDRAAISQIASLAVNGETEPRLQGIVDWLAGILSDGESCTSIVSGGSCETAISALVFIAAYEETEPSLKEKILSTLRKNSAFSHLADIAANENIEPYLRRRILKMFERALDDGHEGVPQAAIDATGELAPSRRQVDILEIASTHRLQDIRLRAMEILGALANDDMGPGLRTRIVTIAARALRDNDKDVRDKAEWALTANLINTTDAGLREKILGIMKRHRIFPTYLLAESQLFVDSKLKEKIVEMLERASAHPNKDVRLKAVEELAWIVTPVITGSFGPSCGGLYGSELQHCGAMGGAIYNSRGVGSGLMTRALRRLTEIADDETEAEDVRSAADGAITDYLMRMPHFPLSSLFSSL